MTPDLGYLRRAGNLCAGRGEYNIILQLLYTSRMVLINDIEELFVVYPSYGVIYGVIVEQTLLLLL